MEGELINTQEGLEGELGYKGDRGYSAYEIAVKNGYEGTEQDWIDHFGLDLTDYLKTTDVVNDTSSTSTTKPLSANIGHNLSVNVLNTMQDDFLYKTREDQFAEVTGTMTGASIGDGVYCAIDYIDYPEGLIMDKDKTYILSAKLKPHTTGTAFSTDWVDYPYLHVDMASGGDITAYARIWFTNDYIGIALYTTNNIDGKDFDYKVKLYSNDSPTREF